MGLISGCWRRGDAAAGFQSIFYIPFTAFGCKDGK
jgi:hypothetical protein